MKASELAQQLMLQPDREVLLLINGEWVEVCGTKATGQHRNAVTLEVINPGVNGVIVVEPDADQE